MISDSELHFNPEDDMLSTLLVSFLLSCQVPTGNCLDKSSNGFLNACLEDGGSTDGGTPDAGTPDGGTIDGGSPDAGSTDAGTTDGGNPDGGTPDGGTPDGGLPDGGSSDGGTIDGGSPDGGSPDGGTPDGGTIDGGSPDGGTIDGGTTDGGSIDGGGSDGGTTDGGLVDGGLSDGGSTDGGTIDGGTPDGGTTDGGLVDGGSPDGGTSDGGTPDGGTIDGGSIDDGGTSDGGSVGDGGTPDGGTDDTGIIDGGTPDGGSAHDDTGTTDGGSAGDGGDTGVVDGGSVIDDTGVIVDGGTVLVDNDMDGYTDDVDCNDDDPDIHPDAIEVCDGVDQDCDDLVDEEVMTTYYADVDGDGYGNPESPFEACATPGGYVLDNTDCDDDVEYVNPGASEKNWTLWDDDCNGVEPHEDGTYTYGAGGTGEGVLDGPGSVTFTGPNLVEGGDFRDGVGDWVVTASAMGYSFVSAIDFTGSSASMVDGTTFTAIQLLDSWLYTSSYSECIGIPELPFVGTVRYGLTAIVNNPSSGYATSNVYVNVNGTNVEWEIVDAGETLLLVAAFTPSVTGDLELAICSGRGSSGVGLTHLYVGTAD